MTTQSDALPRCPSCGHTSIGIETYVTDGFYAFCRSCHACGPYVSKEKAIAAFTNPAHALAASRAEVERLRAEVVRLRERVAFFNGAVPTMVQCFDTLVSGLDGNKHSVERSIKGLREYVAKLKADAALSTAQQGGNQ
jgi:hypothetical protein